MKILALLPIWHRFGLLKLSVESLLESDIEPYLVISPGEDKEIIDYAKQFRHSYHENIPIGSKLNQSIADILKKEVQFDFLMNFGSDNLINPELVKIYESYLNKYSFFGIDDFYIFDIVSKRTVYFKMFGVDYGIGAGRMIRKDILLRLQKKGQQLYINSFNSGLDSCSADIIKANFNMEQFIIHSDTIPLILDVKSLQNINSFENLCSLKERIVDADFNWVIRFFGKTGLKLKSLYHENNC